jgi:hypothetical protein
MAEALSCSTCRFWDEARDDRGGSGTGRCRRHAPISQLVLVNDQNDPTKYADWPETEHSDWCGDWQGGAAGRRPLARGEFDPNRTDYPKAGQGMEGDA